MTEYSEHRKRDSAPMGAQLTAVHSKIWPGLFTDMGRTRAGRELQTCMVQPNHVSGLQDLPYNLSRNGPKAV